MVKEKNKDIVQNSTKDFQDYNLIEEDFLDRQLVDVHENGIDLENDIFFEIISSKSDGINSINENDKISMLESIREIREMLSEQQNMKLDRVLKMMNIQEI